MGKNIWQSRVAGTFSCAMPFSLAMLAACAAPQAARDASPLLLTTPPPDCAALVQPSGDPRFPLVRFDMASGRTIYERGLGLRDGRHVLADKAGIGNASGITVLRDDRVPVTTKVVAQDDTSTLMLLETTEDAALPFRGGASAPHPGDTLRLMTTRSTEQLLTLQVSALERNVKWPLFMNVSLETRCGATPGPVLTSDGSLAGWMLVMVLDKRPSALVFDGPVVLRRAEDLLDFGWVRRTYTGMIGQNLTPQLVAAFGLDSASSGIIIRRFSPGSVALAAGVRAEDVLTAMDGASIHDMHDYQSASALKRPGGRAVLHLLRLNHDSHKMEPMVVELIMPQAGGPQQQPDPPDAAPPGG